MDFFLKEGVGTDVWQFENRLRRYVLNIADLKT
jgi:hypothetical protein